MAHPLQYTNSVWITWNNGQQRVQGKYEGIALPGRYILRLDEPAVIGCTGECYSDICFLEFEKGEWKARTASKEPRFTHLEAAQNIYYDEKGDPPY